MKVNQLKAGVILSYLSIGISALISIVYTPIMLSLVGQNEYGIYTLSVSVVSYLNLISLGFGSSYVKFFSGYKANDDYNGIKNLNGLYLIVFFAMGVVAMIAGTVLAANVHIIFGHKMVASELHTLKILVIMLTANLAISFPASVFSSYITANERFFFSRILQVIKHVANPLVVLPLLLLGYKSIGMVAGTVALNLTIDIVYAVYCFQKLKMQISFKNVDFKLLKEIAFFSLFVFVTLIIDQLNHNIDQFLLGALCGSVAVAVYGIGSQLNSYLIQFSRVVSSVFAPRVHRLVAQQKQQEVNQLFIRIGRLQSFLILYILCGFISFGQSFISLWAGEGYETSYYIAIILMLTISVSLMQNIGIEIRRAKNLHKQPAIVMLFFAIINLIISIPLAKLYGGVGCALGTLISTAFNKIYVNIYYHKKVGLDILSFWKNVIVVLPCCIPALLVGWLIERFVAIDSYLILLICIVGYSVVFFAMAYVLSNDYEKNLLKSLYKRRKVIDAEDQ